MNPIDNTPQPVNASQPHPQHPAANTMDGNRPVTKIGGWLIVLAIALVAGILFNLHGLSEVSKLMDDVLVKSIYPTYPGLEGALVFERSVFSLAIVAGIASLVLLLMRKRIAKPFIIGFMVAVVIASIADVMMVNGVFKDSPEALAAVKGDNQVLRTAISAAIWIPYLLRSKRVKQTFVK
jgi:hypothetical protein